MKSNRILALVVCASLALLLAVQPLQPVPAASPAATACRLAAVYGSYEFVAPTTIQLSPGTVIAIPDELIAASPAAFASKGILLFTGNGHIILSAYEDANGLMATPVDYAGDVVNNSNCTATMTLANGVHFGVKLVSFGGADDLVSTTPGFVIVRPARTLGR